MKSKVSKIISSIVMTIFLIIAWFIPYYMQEEYGANVAGAILPIFDDDEDEDKEKEKA